MNEFWYRCWVKNYEDGLISLGLLQRILTTSGPEAVITDIRQYIGRDCFEFYVYHAQPGDHYTGEHYQDYLLD